MHIVHKDAGLRRSLNARAGLRRALTLGGTLIGAVAVTAAFAMPAGATQDAPANNTLIGTGSSTTYSMMQQLDTLFNSSPGCQQFVPFPSSTSLQPLDYSCVGPQTMASSVENPYNDISVQEPALGSSNGIQALEDQGAHGATSPSAGTDIGNVATNENYARSSRALKSTDLKGMNFVAYAEDGVSWFHYTAIAKSPSPSGNLTNLTQTQLEQIWNGTLTNWDQVCNGGITADGCGANAPIVVFSAQEGSGTQSTWKTFLGFDPSAATNQVNCTNISGPGTGCVGPAVIFENEDAQIAGKAFTSSQAGFLKASNPDWGGHSATLTQIKDDAIFLYSAGKYNVQCKVAKNLCGGSPLNGATNALGSVNGLAPTETNILEGAYPVDRYLYNIYSNGSNANIPAATAATLNYVSELGFMCNPNKGAGTLTLDPNTGVAYLNEIQTTIENAGFYPLSAGAASGTVNQTPIDEGTVPNTAAALLGEPSGGQAPGQTSADPGYVQYKTFDTFATTGPNSDPSGYCLTTDTDSNSSS